MSNELLTTGKIAELTGVSVAKIKKSIAALGIEPANKKGVCCYYDASTVKKITAHLST